MTQQPMMQTDMTQQPMMQPDMTQQQMGQPSYLNQTSSYLRGTSGSSDPTLQSYSGDDMANFKQAVMNAILRNNTMLNPPGTAWSRLPPAAKDQKISQALVQISQLPNLSNYGFKRAALGNTNSMGSSVSSLGKFFGFGSSTQGGRKRRYRKKRLTRRKR